MPPAANRCRCQGLPEEELQPYLDALSPEVHSGDDIGWEEFTSAALAQLIATHNPGSASPPTLSQPLPQCDTLKHHVEVVVKLAERAAANAQEPHAS